MNHLAGEIAEVRKRMEEELEAINNSLENSKTGVSTVSISRLIESRQTKLPNGNTAPVLFKIVKELYKLTVTHKAISHIRSDEDAVKVFPTMDLVKEELARLLPAARSD